MSQSFRTCPHCQRTTDIQTPNCDGCGHEFRLHYSPPKAIPPKPEAPKGLPARLVLAVAMLGVLATCIFVGLKTFLAQQQEQEVANGYAPAFARSPEAELVWDNLGPDATTGRLHNLTSAPLTVSRLEIARAAISAHSAASGERVLAAFEGRDATQPASLSVPPGSEVQFLVSAGGLQYPVGCDLFDANGRKLKFTQRAPGQ
jgi:hypothetical protein